jgi:hypothetical protein
VENLRAFLFAQLRYQIGLPSPGTYEMHKVKALHDDTTARQSLAYLCILCKQTSNNFSDFAIAIFDF